MKNLIAILLISVLIFALAGCSEPVPEDEIPEPSQESNSLVEGNSMVEGNFYDEYGYTVTRNGETVRYYPTFMQNYTEIIYDGNCDPTVISGGALTEEEVNSREDVFFEIPSEEDWAMIMQPNTKVTYDLHGFIQNIYYEVPVGSGNYQLSPPEADGVDGVNAEFTLGPDGSAVTLAVGGQMGEWTLSELEIDAYDDGEIRTTEGVFTGTVILEGKIVWNPMIEGVYDLVINDCETDKIPHYVSPDGIRTRKRFKLTIPEGLANSPNLKADEEMYCRVTVSDYSFIFARTEGMEGMTVTQIEPMSNTATFSLGKEGKAQEIKAGSTLGSWKADEVAIIGEGDFTDITARFTGDVTVSGYVLYNELGQYAFYVDESDWDKMPFYISDEYSDESMVFLMHFPEGTENPFELKCGEKLDCSVRLSGYIFRRAPKPVTSSGIVAEIIE